MDKFARRTAQTVQIRIDADLYRRASEVAAHERRTVRGQLEKWIVDGMEIPSRLECRKGVQS